MHIIQGGRKKRTPKKQCGCPLFWTTLYMLYVTQLYNLLIVYRMQYITLDRFCYLRSWRARLMLHGRSSPSWSNKTP